MRQRTNGLFSRNPALRLVVSHSLLGSLFGLLFAVALVVIDAHGLGSLLWNSESGIVAFILLAGGFMITFGSLVAGSAIMLLPHDEDGPGAGGGPRGHDALVPVRVRRRR